MQPTDTAATKLQAGRREWIGLAVLALPTLLLALDLSVLYLALPSLSADLGTDSTQQLWIMDIYGFMIAGFLITMGTLGDRIGRRKLLLIGATCFAATSILAAYANSAEMLIIARALLGIAGATLMPSTLALISNMFKNPQQRGIAIAVWMSCFMGGTAIGPLIGGILLENFWWGSVFLLGVPVMVILLVAGPLLLPEYRDDHAGRLDFFSVALSLAAILPITYGIKELAKNGWEPGSGLTIILGIAFGTIFIRRQRRLADPLLDLRLFANRAFTAALSVGLFNALIMGGIFLLVTLYLQSVKGLSPFEAGLWILPPSLAMIAASMAAPILAQRIRPAYVMVAGFLIAVSGLLLIAQLDTNTGLGILIAGFTLISIGFAWPAALGTDLVVGSAPLNKAGSAASTSEASGEFGLAMGVATLGSLSTAIYQEKLNETMPTAVPGEASEAAREGINSAVVVADTLPESLGSMLLESARVAFTAGLNSVAILGVVLLGALAILVLITLRHIPPSKETHSGSGDGVQDVEETAPASDSSNHLQQTRL